MGTNNILLVDDSVYQLHLLSVILTSQGFDVTVASSGCQALELMKNKEYGIMITDFNMPEMNGVELAARVGKQYPATRVVLVTADEFPALIDRAAKAGIWEMFSKPVDIRRLLSTIRKDAET